MLSEKNAVDLMFSFQESVGPFEDRLPSIGESARTPNKPVDSETLQLIFKLFLGTSDRSVALEAIGKVKEMIGKVQAYVSLNWSDNVKRIDFHKLYMSLVWALVAGNS